MNDILIALAISMLFNFIQIAVNSYLFWGVYLQDNKRGFDNGKSNVKD